MRYPVKVPLMRLWFIPFLALFIGCRPESSFPPPPPMQLLPLFGTITVTPDQSAGHAQRFSVRLDRAPGKPEPTYLGLLINARDNGADACYLFANLETGRPRLVNDSGSGAQELTGPGRIANQQCQLQAAASVIERRDTTIEAHFNLEFKSSFAGPKKLYVIAENLSGKSTGIQLAGDFLVQ